ncbi:MAG: sugar phosphate isomerase/epimerase family protein [Bryobacteraceae bacterium]
MTPKLRIASITDEFSPDLAVALPAMAEIGMTGAELRVLWGKNIMDLSQDELTTAKKMVTDAGMEVIGIASPVLKCVLPYAPAVDERFQQDMFNAKYTFEEQKSLADRAIEIAKFMDCKLIRVFSYWRTVEPEKCFDAVVEAMNWLGEKGARAGVTIGLENEHACNIATGAEAGRLLAAVGNPSVRLVWDPANAMCSGEDPYPEGYSKLPKDRIEHVHVKDCHMEGHKPIWGPVGTRHVFWKGQIDALMRDGYTGWLSLETHWTGPAGNKFEASRICGWNLRGLAAA